MSKFALILPLAFAAQVALAQSSSVPIGLDAERNLAELGNGTNATMVRTYDNRYEGVKGTPFFSEEWRKATITNNNTLYHNIDLRYNVYDNVILYRNSKGEEFILKPSKVEAFELTGNNTQQEYSFKQFPVLATQDASLLNRYVIVLYEGEKTQMVMAPAKKLVKADFKGGYSAGRKYDEFVDAPTYYVIGTDNKATKIKLNKKNLLKTLPDKQEKLLQYIASAKVDLSTEAGWVKALAFYESL